MISALELRHIIESAFLPLSCSCRITPDGFLSVKVFDPHSGRIDLAVIGISIASLVGSRAICALVSQLRTELKANQNSLHAPLISEAS